ncbi:MAG: YicC family protein [Bacteroidales bacterium]|nr:YicC family protein [Bacteroidales bacterium]MBP5517450.1 YicC family protein [Bacteroidales bacterium]
MIKSMTGYGKGECTLADHSKITVEIKSLNGKTADISVKSQIIPKDKELEIRKLLAAELVRGSIDFSLNLELKNSAANKQINREAVLDILHQIKDIQKVESPDAAALPLSNSFLIASIIRMPDVMETRPYEFSDEDWAKIDKAISQAIKKLNSYRETEGTALLEDVLSRVANIMSCLEQVKELDVKRVPAIKERLRQKIDKAGIEANPERLEQEIVFYVEKLDINEEKVRLAQHCKYFMDTVMKDPLAGKKLGFIVQEMGREINTLGSKANDAAIQALVVRMKDELEKIREQSLNIL